MGLYGVFFEMDGLYSLVSIVVIIQLPGNPGILR